MAAMKTASKQSLRKFALRLPDTEEGVACAGTSLEACTIKRKGKAFLFVRSIDARLKLGPSLADAVALAATAPERYSVGAGGWVHVKLDGPIPLDLAERWINESYKLAGGGKAGSAKESSRRAKVTAK